MLILVVDHNYKDAIEYQTDTNVRNRNKNVLNLFSNFDCCTRLDVELFFRGYVFFYLIFFVECGRIQVRN